MKSTNQAQGLLGSLRKLLLHFLISLTYYRSPTFRFAVLDEEDRKEFDGEDMDGGLMVRLFVPINFTADFSCPLKGTIQANLRKKSKNNKTPQLPNDIPEPAPPALEPPQDDDDDGVDEDASPTRLLSKKEKEKLKKDREKVSCYCVDPAYTSI
jgi:hypothetical protein